MYQYAVNAPLIDQKTLGIAALRLGGGVVVSARNDPTRYLSKAAGFGFDEPVTPDLVDQILFEFRAEGVAAASLAFAPEVLPDDWAEIVASRGLRPGTRIVKLVARVEDFVPTESRLRIAPVTGDDATPWAEAVLTGFDTPSEAMRGMFAATVGHPQFHPFAAWDGARIVGGGNLFVHGAVAELKAGSMLPGARRRGGHAGLITARAAKARELGCGWLVTECVQPARGEQNSALNNMLRSGFKALYVRQDFATQTDS